MSGIMTVPLKLCIASIRKTYMIAMNYIFLDIRSSDLMGTTAILIICVKWYLN
jgi:hypothetical protein